MKATLDDIDAIIREYRKGNPAPGDLVDMMRRLSADLAYLQTERSRAHEAWQATVFNLTKNGEAVNRAENQAHVAHPEMYLLRRVMEGGYKVLEAMRSQLSWIKKEMETI